MSFTSSTRVPFHDGDLCDSCEAIDWTSVSGTQRHIKGYLQLVQSAASCPICELICTGLRRAFCLATGALQEDRNDFGAIDQAIENSVLSPDNEFAPGFPGWIAMLSVSCGSETLGWRLWAFWSPQATCGLDVDKSKVPFASADMVFPKKAFEDSRGAAMIMLWAITGYFQEKSCATLPTRLLDLQCPDGKIHLVEPAPGSNGIYATLSYRWGARRDHLTTKDTLNQHIQQVQIGHLPQVFQDAIELCRCLDVQYLWIDSLCIIQDDTEDWERESSLMGRIYAQSIFTIAAHTAGSDEEGFLHNYNPLFHVIRRDGTGQLWKIALSRGFEAEMTSNSSISHRGWVLQERLLSKRILHFLPSAVYIETKDGVGELGRQRDVRDARTPMLARPLSDDDSKMIALRSLRSLSQWFAIVEIYSRCGLTNDRDKLPAMIGIATKLQITSRDGYISGLWINDDIPSQLVWYTADGTSAKRPKPLRAPSLSWASLDGSIKYFPLNKEGEEYRTFLKSKAPINYHRLPMTSQHLISLDKDHLINTIRHRDTSEPYQIQENISLLFHGTLADLPSLGRRSKPSNEPLHEDLIDGVFDALRSVQFYRPIELGGETIGVVFLDEDSDEDVSGTKFQFVSVGGIAKVVVGLIVVEDEDNKGTLRRAGLGLLIRWFRSGTPVLESGDRRQPILFS